MTNLSDESNSGLKSDKFKKSKDMFIDKQFLENSTNNQNGSVRKMNVNTTEDMRKRVDYIKKDLRPL